MVHLLQNGTIPTTVPAKHTPKSTGNSLKIQLTFQRDSVPPRPMAQGCPSELQRQWEVGTHGITFPDSESSRLCGAPRSTRRTLKVKKKHCQGKKTNRAQVSGVM